MAIPNDDIEAKKLDLISEALRLDELTARRNGLVMVQKSARLFTVIRLRSPSLRGGKTVYLGEVVHGPARRDSCEDFIASYEKTPS